MKSPMEKANKSRNAGVDAGVEVPDLYLCVPYDPTLLPKALAHSFCSSSECSQDPLSWFTQPISFRDKE